MENLEEIFANFEKDIAQVKAQPDLMNIKAKYIGGKGLISLVMKSLKDVDAESRRAIGSKANSFKTKIEQIIDSKLVEFDSKSSTEALSKEWVDPTLRDSNLVSGMQRPAIHPVHSVQREIEDIFISMGFEILDGPHIETDYYNFEALNIPEHHPARDMQDTFWFAVKPYLLRTHTSAVQVRGMQSHEPPFKFIAPGKCFRCERTDASHEMVFHQVEGMMVGEGIAVSHLIYFMKTLLRQIFRKDVDVRLRPGFFPFVEPGFELDIRCLICSGSGCSVCKNSGWLELLPCGMVHPAVLRHGKIDTQKFSGFAFGLGLDRLVMMRYGIDDIRLIHSGDLRFTQQFSAF